MDIYQRLERHGFRLVQRLEEIHDTDGQQRVWRIAVWQDAQDCLYYAVEIKSGSQFTDPHFAGLTHWTQLTRIYNLDAFRNFKVSLHGHWRAQRKPAKLMDDLEKCYRNARTRLQAKVGHRLMNLS